MENFLNENTEEIPVGELRQQLEYAGVIGGDLFNLFAGKSERNNLRPHEYRTVETKLSMLLDFIFQARLWCDVLEENVSPNGNFNVGEEKCEN